MSDPRLDESYVHCGAIARGFARDRWLASLFALEAKRKHLQALIAFAYEIGRIKQIAREPVAGEIRLTWWIEAVEGLRDDEASANPIAAALLATIAECGLPKARFEAWLLGIRDDIYDKPADSSHTRAPFYALSARALGGEAEAAADAAGRVENFFDAGEAAVALDEIAKVEALLKTAQGEVAPAFAALGALKLDAKRALRGKPAAPNWRRQIAIWLWGRAR